MNDQVCVGINFQRIGAQGVDVKSDIQMHALFGGGGCRVGGGSPNQPIIIHVL